MEEIGMSSIRPVLYLIVIGILFTLVSSQVYADSFLLVSNGVEGGNGRSVFVQNQKQADNLKALESMKLPPGRIDFPRVPASVILSGGRSYGRSSGVDTRKVVTSVLLSAIVPGMGEAYLWYGSRELSTLARVPLFLAAEGYFWHGYFHNHAKGKDYKEYYKKYADEHWSLDRFLLQHPCCENVEGCESYEEYNNMNAEGDCDYNFFIFTPKEIDEEEYYENIGKYDAFVFGWDDWNGQPDYWTPHRRVYWELRKRSDEYLVKGDNFLMYLLVNRVVSMIDAGWLAYRMNRGDDLGKGWSIDIKSVRCSPTVIIGYRF